MNFYEDSINCEAWDKYIKEKSEQGIKIGYMQIFIAGVIRMLALKPRLNRFVMNGKLYARPKIWVSFTIHPELHIDSPDTTIKLDVVKYLLQGNRFLFYQKVRILHLGKKK